MSLARLFYELKAHKIHLSLIQENQIKVDAPKGALTDSLKKQLVDAKEQLIEWMCLKQIQSTEGVQIAPFNEPSYPMTKGQMGLFFHELLNPGTSTYNVPIIFRFAQCPNVMQLKRAFERLIQQHPSLRTRFMLEGEQPIQRIDPKGQVAFEYKTWGELSEFCYRPFDLTAGPPVRLSLIESENGSVVMAFVLHHIVTDAVSSGLLLSQLSDFYQNETIDIPPAKVNMGDVALYERQLPEFSLDKLMNRLSTVPLKLNFTQQPKLNEACEGRYFHFDISSILAGKLAQVASDLDISMASLSLGIYAMLIRSCIDHDRFLIGLAIADREADELAHLVGYLINTVVAPMSIDSQTAISAFLDETQEVMIEALESKSISFERLVDELKPERDDDMPPIIQAMFTFHRSDVAQTSFLGLPSERINIETQAAKFPITLGLCETSSGISGTFEYSTAFFRAELIEELAKQFVSIATQLTLSVNQKVSQLLNNVPYTPVSMAPIEASTCMRVEQDLELVSSLRAIWEGLFAHSNFSDEDSFFELGGNSLLAIKFVAKARESGIEIPLKTVFKQRSLRQIAQSLKEFA